MELSAKIFGLVLLLVGVAIIGWAIYSSYNIFTGKVAAPAIFQLPEATQVTTKGKATGTMGVQDIQAQVQQMLGEQLKSFLPTDMLPKILNLGTWLTFAFFLIFAGGQISGLGIKLIKK